MKNRLACWHDLLRPVNLADLARWCTKGTTITPLATWGRWGLCVVREADHT